MDLKAVPIKEASGSFMEADFSSPALEEGHFILSSTCNSNKRALKAFDASRIASKSIRQARQDAPSRSLKSRVDEASQVLIKLTNGVTFAVLAIGHTIKGERLVSIILAEVFGQRSNFL